MITMLFSVILRESDAQCADQVKLISRHPAMRRAVDLSAVFWLWSDLILLLAEQTR